MKYLIKNKNWEINKEYNVSVLLFVLVDRPSSIAINGNMFWFNGYKYRSYGLPYFVDENGYIELTLNDQQHFFIR